MKTTTPVVLHTPSQKRYIESLPTPGRQGSYRHNPVRKLTKFNKNNLPKNLFDSMSSVKVRIDKQSLQDLLNMSCINIQRDVELHKSKLIRYLLGDEVNLSTMTSIILAYIKDTGEYLIIDGNTRLALCVDELVREIDEHKKRRFAIPEYFNVIIHEYDTQKTAEQAYKTLDNSNAVESIKQKLQGVLYSSGHTDWLSHGILGHCSYANAMQDLLVINGNKNAGKMTAFDMLDIFDEDLEHFYRTFNYKFANHPSTRFIMAYLGLRLGYKDQAKEMYPKIDKFLKAAAAYNPLKQGLYGNVGAGMFHNEFINKVMADSRYLRKEMHVTTNPKMTFGIMLNYFEGWKEGKEYSGRITAQKEKLVKNTHVFFRGE